MRNYRLLQWQYQFKFPPTAKHLYVRYKTETQKHRIKNVGYRGKSNKDKGDQIYDDRR